MDSDRPTLPTSPIEVIEENSLEPTFGFPIRASFKDETGKPLSLGFGVGAPPLEVLEKEISEEVRREIGPGPWPIDVTLRANLERATSRVFCRYMSGWRFIVDRIARNGEIEAHFERTDLSPEERRVANRVRAQTTVRRLIEENIERPTDQLEELVRVLEQLFDDYGAPR